MTIFDDAVRALPDAAKQSSSLDGGFLTYLVNSGVDVDEGTSMRLGAVFSCVRNISQDYAVSPIHMYMKDGSDPRKKEKVVDHPTYRMLHDRANEETSAFNMKQSLMANVLLWGNAYAYKERDASGNVVALWNLTSDSVFPKRSEDGGELLYQIGSKTYTRHDIMHIPGLGFDGVSGRSCIQYAREPVSMGLAAEELGAKFFGKGAHLGGVISVKGTLPDEAFERTRIQFNEMYKGLENSMGIPILEDGAVYTNTTMPLKDAQYIETRKFSRNEIAMMFRMPPHKIGDLERATFSNIEEQDTDYYVSCLLPWFVCFEQNFMMQLLDEEEVESGLFIKTNADAFMRGNTKDRYEAHSLAINAQWMAPNEARELEDMNPFDDPAYDEPIKPLNMADKGGDPQESELKDKSVEEDHSDDTSDDEENEGKRSLEVKQEDPNDLFREREGLKELVLPKLLSMRLMHIGTDEKAVADLAAEKTGQELKDAVIKYFGTRYEDVSSDMQAVLQPFSMYVMASAVSETGKSNVNLDNARYAKFAKSYCDSYAKGYLAETKRAVLNAIDAATYGELREEPVMESSEGYDEAQSISDAFEEMRGGELEGQKQDQNMKDEANKALGAFLVMAYTLLGIKRKVWVGVGTSCPMCSQLIGKTVEVEKSFTEPGGSLEWYDNLGRVQTMTTQYRSNPPLHKGCDCQVQASI